MSYPYFIVPQVEEYKKLDPQSEEAKKLARIIAANVGDLAALRLILGIDPPEFARFYPDMQISTPSTMDTIDAFLDKFGTKGNTLPPAVTEIASLENETVPANDPDTEITISIETIESQSITDLKTLITQHRYDEALLLIEQQNLNNPEKSIYFAHQIRFLKKLMALENFKNLTKG